jgi:hypothetical protein
MYAQHGRVLSRVSSTAFSYFAGKGQRASWGPQNNFLLITPLTTINPPLCIRRYHIVIVFNAVTSTLLMNNKDDYLFFAVVDRDNGMGT